MIEITQEVAPGIYFAAASSSASINGPVVVVPMAALPHMSDEAIGKAVRSLLPQVELAQALAFADWINISAGERHEVPDFVLEDYAEDCKMLERFSGHDTAIDMALAKIRKAQERPIRKAAHQIIRRDIQAHYDTFFVQIGRRDGFHCQHCQATVTLEIDHIIAVANGGTNDLDNLQLLCQSCNSRKSDKA